MVPPIWEHARSISPRSIGWREPWDSSRSSRICCAAAAWPIPTRPRGSCGRRSIICTRRRSSPGFRKRSRASRVRWPIVSASRSTATTTSTASRRRSSFAGRWSSSAATSAISFPSVCATATACSRPPSTDCTPMASSCASRSTAAFAAWRRPTRARELGLDLIITDHHEPGAALPPAVAVINPKRHDCPYPDKHLAGVGVALEAGSGAVRRTRQGEVAARVPQGRGHRNPCRRRTARGRKPGHHQARPRSAEPGTAQGRPAGAADRLGACRAPNRRLRRQLRSGAARECRRPHEHARHRDAPAARERRCAGRRGEERWRSS